MITFIDTNACERKKLEGGRGEAAEIVNAALCGAEKVKGTLRWLSAGESFDAAPLPGAHQLLYLMEGNGTIDLEGKSYEVGPGAGLYLAPDEGAALRQSGSGTLKAFHVVVPPR